MSHPEQMAFFDAVVRCNQDLLPGAKLLEIGSYDVNGSVRNVFAGVESYVGVDLTEGPGVDIVGYGHEVDHPDGSFDITLSGECFEHDQHWRETFRNMVRLTRPGGLVAITCASTGRPEHGTTRTTVGLSPGTQSRGLDYYRNLAPVDFLGVVSDEDFTDFQFWTMPTSFDLYFAGVRAGAVPDGAAVGHVPDDADVAEIRKIMPLPHKLARLPLRVTRSVVDEPRYQDAIHLYWKTLLKVAGDRATRTVS